MKKRPGLGVLTVEAVVLAPGALQTEAQVHFVTWLGLAYVFSAFPVPAQLMSSM